MGSAYNCAQGVEKSYKCYSAPTSKIGQEVRRKMRQFGAYMLDPQGQESGSWWYCHDLLFFLEAEKTRRQLVLGMIWRITDNQEAAQQAWTSLSPLCANMLLLVIDVHNLREARDRLLQGLG